MWTIIGAAISFGGVGSDGKRIAKDATVTRTMEGIGAQTKNATENQTEGIGKTAPDFGVVLGGDMVRVSAIRANGAALIVKAECAALTAENAGRAVVGDVLLDERV